MIAYVASLRSRFNAVGGEGGAFLLIVFPSVILLISPLAVSDVIACERYSRFFVVCLFCC